VRTSEVQNSLQMICICWQQSYCERVVFALEFVFGWLSLFESEFDYWRRSIFVYGRIL